MSYALYLTFSAALVACHGDQRPKRAAPEVMCPRGYAPELVAGRPKSCEPELDNDCPDGFFCNLYFDSSSKKEANVCCGKARQISNEAASSSSKDPNPFSLTRIKEIGKGFQLMDFILDIMKSFSNRVNTTTPFNSKKPTQMIIETDADDNTGSEGNSDQCPSGDPYKDRETGKQHECNVGVKEGGGCPPGYYCHGTKTGDITGMCCQSVEEIEPPPIGCPWGLEPLKTDAGQVVTCTPGKPDACPGKAICYYDAVESQNKCCGKSPGKGCPRGSRPQGKGDQLVTCRPGVPSQTCSGDAICQWSYLIDRYQCCENDNGCPAEMDPLVTATGQPQSCAVDQSNSCPSNYECRFNFWTSGYQCCGKNLGSCPVGQVPYIKGGSKLATPCPNGQSTLCPAGYNCAISTNNQYLCCGRQGRCPVNMQPFITGANGRGTACSPNVPNNCPAPSTCQPTTQGPMGQYLCCSSGGGGISPGNGPGPGPIPGVVQYKCTGNRPGEQVPGSTQPRQCTIGLPNQCSNGYRCEGSTTVGIAICCSVNIQPANVRCPSGNSPDIQGTAPWYCPGPASQSCRSGYSCQSAQGTTGVYVCCLSSQTLVQCPAATVAEVVSGTPRYCSPGQMSACAAGYSCQMSSNFPGTYICCSTPRPAIAEPMCQFNRSPDRNGANIWYCLSPGSPGCRSGFSCQESANYRGNYVCCPSSAAQSAKCPGGGDPDMNGLTPYYCSGIGATNCRSGHTCLQSESNTNQFLCCPSGLSIMCPGNQRPDMLVGTNPFYCSGVGQPGCRGGFTCQESPNFARRYVCCTGSGGASTNVLCPGNKQPDFNGLSPAYCNGVGQATCRLGYTCEAAVSGQYGVRVCCPDSTPLCQDGQQPDRNGATSIWYCLTAGTTSGCRDGHICEQTLNQPGVNVCCKGRTSSTFMCPGNQSPALQGSNTWYCPSPSAPGCPARYSCQASMTNPSVYLCCPQSGGQQQPICPTGFTSNLINNYPQPCILNSPGTCAVPFECTQASNRPGYYICCKRNENTQGPCPMANQLPLQVNGQTQYCSSPGGNCGQPGYTCQLSSALGRYLCCGNGNTNGGNGNNGNGNGGGGNAVYQCANGRNVWAPNNQAYYCIVGRNQCPSGYSCQPSTDQSRYVCCLTAGVQPETNNLQCASGRQPYTASNGATKICSAALPGCPSGYSCELSSVQGTDICCFTGTTTFRCPRGWTGYRIGTDTQTCKSTRPAICPGGYSCIESTQTNTFVCCKPGMSPYENQEGSLCSNEGAPLTNDIGQIRYCSPALFDPCPMETHECVRNLDDEAGTSYICCTKSTSRTEGLKDCPAPLAAEIEGESNRPKVCLSNADCITDYICVLSLIRNEQVCCGGTENVDSGAIVVSKMCHNGLPALVQDGMTVTCEFHGDHSCPMGYECQVSNGGSTHYCCETLDCPTGMTLVSEGPCSLDTTDTCPADSMCTTLNAAQDETACCKPEVDPAGPRCVARDTLMKDGNPVFCRLPNTCDDGYECSSLSTTNQYICCKNIQIKTDDVCPRGEEPYVDPITYDYFACSEVGYACPTGYICKTHIQDPAKYICCKAKAMCQRGWLPYIQPGDTNPMRCSIDNPTSCSPPGKPYRCQLSTLPGEYLCCMESLIQWSVDQDSDGKKGNHSMTIEEFLEDLS